MSEKEKTAFLQKDDILLLEPKYFGPFWDYVQDDSITDVDFNGTDLWITDTKNRRTKIEDHGVTADFVQAFSQRVANQVSKPFNQRNNLLEAETKTLRISIIHESAAVSGRSVCIRKTLPNVRITAKSIVEENYMPRPILNLLANCIMAKMNVIIGGEPGAGKTECAKFFTQFVHPTQRVITIEDSPEWHFHEINPYHDCVELRVNPDFDYAKAIKTCLRQNPKWIMLSEARSVEVKHLIESWSTGVNGVTTIHTDDIRKVPSRLLNMMANRDDADRLENDIYDFVNVALLVRRKAMPDGSAHRYIDQMGFLYRDGKENHIHMLVKNGELVSDILPEDIAFRLQREYIEKPFECPAIDERIGDSFTYTPMESPVPLPKRMTAVPVTAAPTAAPVAAEPEKQVEPLEKREIPEPGGHFLEDEGRRWNEPESGDLDEFGDVEADIHPEAVKPPKLPKSAAKPAPRQMASIGSLLNKRRGGKVHANDSSTKQ